MYCKWVVFLFVFTKHKHSQSCGLGSEVLKPEISAPGKVIAESLLSINHPMKPLQKHTILVTLCYWAVKSPSVLLRDAQTDSYESKGDGS